MVKKVTFPGFTSLRDRDQKGNRAQDQVDTIARDVQDSIDELAPRLTPVANVRASYQINIWETVLYDPSAGTFTLKIPTNAVAGDRFAIKNTSASATTITIEGTPDVKIEDPDASFSLSRKLVFGGDRRYAEWISNGTDWLSVCCSSDVVGGANGQKIETKLLTEEHTLAAGQTSTSGIAIPADALVLFVTVRVTELIT